jgi:hypothetical protein
VVTGWRGRVHIGRVSGRTAVRTAFFESGRVHQALADELGHPVPVDAVLAVHGARMANWRAPAVDGVPLMRADKVRHWIQHRPAEFGTIEVSRIAEIAERVFPPFGDRPQHQSGGHHQGGRHQAEQPGIAYDPTAQSTPGTHLEKPEG